jgi:hypothetical protein
MGPAMLVPGSPDQTRKGKKENQPEPVGFSQQRLREARQILHHSPELVIAVGHGFVGKIGGDLRLLP